MATANKYPAGTTHVLMRLDRASPARRVDDGWCLLDAMSNWVFCGEEVRGYKVDIATGIVWGGASGEDKPLAYVVKVSGSRRAVGVTAHEAVDMRGVYSFDTITQAFVDAWHPVRAPADAITPGKRIPVKFSCPVSQYAHDNGLESGSFPRPGFYGRMAKRLAIDLRDLKAELAARDVAPVSWRQMGSAPRDGQMLRLVVRFTEHSTEDGEIAYTIGSNNFDNDEVDEWQFAGWCWTHDHFVDGKGEPIGWLPMLLGGDK